MARLFTCDKCGAEFPEPLDQEMYKDEHGVTTMLDLCAPCRKLLKQARQKPEDNFLGEIIKKGDK